MLLKHIYVSNNNSNGVIFLYECMRIILFKKLFSRVYKGLRRTGGVFHGHDTVTGCDSVGYPCC